MCGIFGFIKKDGIANDDISLLQKLSGLIAYRGPDDSGYYTDSFIGMAHRRLSIIDLNTGHQPMFNEDKTLAIVFNGEIYNYKELKQGFAGKHTFCTDSDTEVLLHLYEDFGAGMLNLLDGMFAFAIWDAKQRHLFLARDRFGKKPLYYYIDNKSFIFSSEIKSIVNHPSYRKEVDFENISKFLFLEYFSSPGTPFKHIYKLPPANYLVFNKNSWEEKKAKYWDIFETADFRNPGKSFEELKDEYYRLFVDSVKKRLVSDVEVGVFLSGGVDSSSVAAVVCNGLKKQGVKTFSINFEEKSFDESVYSQTIARFVGSDHKYWIFSMDELLNVIDEVLEKLDEPFGDSSILPTYMLSKLASEFVKVVLSGDGNDEQFCGYQTFQAEKYYQVLKAFPGGLWRHLGKAVNLFLPANFEDMSFEFRLKRLLSGLNISDYALRNQKWMGSFDFDEQRSLFKKNKLDAVSANLDFINRIDEKNLSDFQKLAYFYMKNYMQEDILYKVDRSSMFNSLEVRCPFLDYRLAEFVWQIPDAYKLKGMQTKYLFKKAFVGKLPQGILARKKKGFSVPLGRWFNTKLKDDLHDTLYNIDFLNSNYIEKVISEHHSARVDHKKKLWTLYVLGKWYDKFFK